MTACNVTQRYAFSVGGKRSLCLNSPCITHTHTSLSLARSTPPRSHSGKKCVDLFCLKIKKIIKGC